MSLGTQAIGLRMPIIKPGDDVKNIICDELKKMILANEIKFDDNDVLAITESLIARAYNNYVTVDDIANFIKVKYGNNATVGVLWPIYSRNRFSMILRGIARGAKRVIVQLHHGKDEVGNDIVNPWTGIDITDYYKEIILEENAEAVITQSENAFDIIGPSTGNVIVSTIHSRHDDTRSVLNFLAWNDKQDAFNKIIKLSDIFTNPAHNRGWCEYGLLGSNKCGEKILKLFPTKDMCKETCDHIKEWVYDEYGKNIHVMVYGDGCFKDPSAGIWEFADPISCPYHTGDLLDKSPHELKIKYVVDCFGINEQKIKEYIKIKDDKDMKTNPLLTQGTTPRKYYDLLASLCDLTSGSGDKGTPVILIKNYFKNFADA